jgi:hypothetical protein
LAPNGYHNGGLVEYSTAYPNATLVAPPVVHERLQGRTGLSFDGFEALGAALPKGMRLENPDGLKNGETWLIAHIRDRCVWHVVDAFGAQKNSEGLLGDKLRPNKVFPSFGIKDRAVYLNSLNALLASDTPDMLLPCHGAIVEAADISAQMAEIYPELNEV